MHQAVESYEKQAARDKMIIKFREDRISKLEAGQKDEDYMKTLKSELALWKESCDHNA